MAKFTFHCLNLTHHCLDIGLWMNVNLDDQLLDYTSGYRGTDQYLCSWSGIPLDTCILQSLYTERSKQDHYRRSSCTCTVYRGTSWWDYSTCIRGRTNTRAYGIGSFPAYHFGHSPFGSIVKSFRFVLPVQVDIRWDCWERRAHNQRPSNKEKEETNSGWGMQHNPYLKMISWESCILKNLPFPLQL